MSEANTNEGGGWWFVREGTAESSAVSGPHRPREMRRRYLKGLLGEHTFVRFLPLDDRPADDEHVGQPFAQLQELCSAAGPPFMEQVGHG